MLNKLRAHLSVFALTSLVISVAPQAHAIANLEAEAIHKQTAQEIVASLQLGHYAQKPLNDSLSAKLLDAYIDDLDPARIHFLAKDIADFQPFSKQLDDDLKSGDLSKAFTIYTRYITQAEARLTYSIDLLENHLSEFSFDVDEEINTDRSKSPRAETDAEIKDIWRKRVKSALLNLKLAGKTLPEAKEVLIKRYKNQFDRIEQTNSEDIFQRYINSLTELYDPHTSYFSPQRSKNFEINMSLSLEGIGAVLQRENEYTKVVRLVPAGPADKAGQLKPADFIVGVGQDESGDIEDVVGWRLDEVVELIRGPKGSTVRLEIIPSDAEDKSQRKVIKIVRNKVKLEEQAAQKRIIEIEHSGEKIKIGVIEVPAFYIDFAALQRGDKDYKSTTRDVSRLITELQQENIEGLIVDLRNNGGGSLREANEMVGLFINRGPTVQIQDTNGRIDILGDRDPNIAYKGPVAVLVNRLSASASEIFAGAIQDYQRGIVLGGQTFGKGTVQSLQPLEHGRLKLTHAKFYRISGESTQNKGVVPDINFPTLYDKEEIGESALEDALPWDTVRPVRHGRFIGFNNFLDQLKAKHQVRANQDPDFMFMRSQVERLEELRSDTTTSLNESTLKQERESADQWQLEAENKRRQAKSLAPIKNLSEIEKTLKKDKQGKPINPESEAILLESGRILVDLMELTVKYAAARKN